MVERKNHDEAIQLKKNGYFHNFSIKINNGFTIKIKRKTIDSLLGIQLLLKPIRAENMNNPKLSF